MEITVDAENLYWSNQGANVIGSIMKMPLSGGPPVVLASATYPQAIAVDATNVYWTNFEYTGSVMKVPVSGGNLVTLASGTGMTNTFALGIDGTSAYFTNLGDGRKTGSIMKVPLVGGATTTILGGVDSPATIAFAAMDVLYVESGTSGGTLEKVGLSGGAVSAFSQTGVLAVATDASFVYVLTGTEVRRLPLGGGPPVTLATSQRPLGGMALDATTVYWSNFEGTVSTIKSTSKTP